MIAFGISQLISPKAWIGYIPSWLARLLPMYPAMFMITHAAGNLTLGWLLLLGLFPVVVGSATLVWWVSILPFAFMYQWTIGMRDLSIVAALVSYLLLVSG